MIYKKGTPVSVSTFIAHNDQKLVIGDPSAPALFLSQSHQAYINALHIHPFEKGPLIGDESTVSKIVYSYLEYISASIIFAYTALEVFANEEIPEKFMFETKKTMTKLSIAHSKKSIERYISLDDKLGSVLPKAIGVSSPRGLAIWSKFVDLRRLRDRIIHLKSEDRQVSKVNNLYPKTIWSELMAPDQPYFPLIAKNMMLHFRDKDQTHWLKYCPF